MSANENTNNPAEPTNTSTSSTSDNRHAASQHMPRTNDPTIASNTHGRGYGRMHTIDKRRTIHPEQERLTAKHPELNIVDAETAASIERGDAEIDKERAAARAQERGGKSVTHHGHALAGILGPAFVAAVAYVDPGNVAANVTSGARYGYLLVWVLVLANAMSVLIQYQSAKLGIVTGKSLPELLGERMHDAGRFMFFMQAEVIAIATDLAELIGGAIALNLLFGLPLFVGGVVIGAVSTVLLLFEGGKTHRLFEKMVIALLLVITFGFIAGLFIAPPNPADVAAGLIPHFTTTDSVLMASSMLGATVMPHAIYLHSTLVNDHYAGGQEKPSIKRLLDGSKVDVFWALLLAGTVNLSLLILAANSLYGMKGTDSIEGAQHAIVAVLGPVIGTIFSIGLLASSLSSTSVGTYAGSEIMHGLLRIKAPMWACRVVTLVPGLIVLWFAPNPTEALVIGQVILSVGIPFAIIPLMRYTHDKQLMGKWVDGPIKHAIFIAVAVLIIALNVLLIVLTLLGKA
ncbi:NRAMP family Mn2 and Fe2 transporter [Bifidobacterium saguini DSM 23967]|uniref:NRAMP family Mn2 and Fe2 transporter n=2 Tax=Bifidobacterium saguini TaxID=762210 RepID=A0A087D7R0_9BIFI|nr:NRAMP family Mn2 and Fe2 transporter [Bifidobacterium saguini DSM 23967]